MSAEKSYSQILSASSIMGSAACLSLLLGMVRVKFAAMFIGAAGVGLMTSFSSLQGFVSTLFGLGIHSSAVREVAAAVSRGDEEAIGRTVLTLRRMSWATGLLGMAAMIALSVPLSRVTFGHGGYAVDISALGIAALLSSISSGHIALIQGMQRIGDMARTSIYSAALSTVLAIGFYISLGMRGVVPALVAIAVIQLTVSSWFVRRISFLEVRLSWRESISGADGMIRLGLVMMWNGLMGAAVAYLTIILITTKFGAEGVGLYSAAVALSAVFVNFILGAMSADYFPRLTSVASDKPTMIRLVNEQSEVALLLVIPGLLATIVLAPWVLQIFYSREFLGAVELLQWLAIGCLGRVIAWPLGFVMLALSKRKWFLVTETGFNIGHLALVALGLEVFGMKGVAIAVVMMYAVYIGVVLWVCRRLIGFGWSNDCTRLVMLAVLVVTAVFFLSRSLSIWPATIFGSLLTASVTVVCIRVLAVRVGSTHPMVRLATKVPGGRFLVSAR